MDHHSSIDYNDTSLEGDPFAEIDEEIWEQEVNHHHMLMTAHAILDTLKFLTCLLVVAVQIFLAITILRFKRLRTRTNMYIVNMCLLGTLFYFVLPVSVVLLRIVFNYTFGYRNLLGIQHVLLVLYMTFAIGLAIDWVVSGFKSSITDVYNVYFKYIIGTLYLVSFLYWIIAFSIFDEDEYPYPENRLMIISELYSLYLIILITINLLKKRIIGRNECIKTAYALTVSNITLFSFVLIYIYVFILYMSRHTNSFIVDIIILLLDPFFLLIPIGHPILITYMLGRENKYFKMAYNRTFKRSVRNYTDDNLDEVSIVESPQNNTVTVNFANDNEQGDNNILVI